MLTDSNVRPYQFQLAPDRLWQAINPWTWNLDTGPIGLINVNIGATKRPETERAILDEVGSYGRQIGHIGDALEVLIRHLDLKDLGQSEQDALDVLKGDLAQIRGIKARDKGS
ncbi:hypothetical protein [Novosphingobium mangrovi (ex Huang et al. 2023)]|uniref:Uncharacterized protein n=1 Tax=Novosphingobium mangrovi (ex Huang et al. 2023) TaxID=2976432 RepID=A0ABT2I0Q0_9SPHN|nr:hypothetical protein [Novosphingobium mangrovi (ex Huang et al. 2023)]MCT2398378.1 hypothetical protein [Novosphingobium mangrovi (ex Huang et al. 2023)]